jgi:hypothetical protein
MIKVLWKGKPRKQSVYKVSVRRFKCECGCRFKSDEYKTEARTGSGLFGARYYFTTTAVCPLCEADCYKFS